MSGGGLQNWPNAKFSIMDVSKQCPSGGSLNTPSPSHAAVSSPVLASHISGTCNVIGGRAPTVRSLIAGRRASTGSSPPMVSNVGGRRVTVRTSASPSGKVIKKGGTTIGTIVAANKNVLPPVSGNVLPPVSGGIESLLAAAGYNPDDDLETTSQTATDKTIQSQTPAVSTTVSLQQPVSTMVSPQQLSSTITSTNVVTMAVSPNKMATSVMTQPTTQTSATAVVSSTLTSQSLISAALTSPQLLGPALRLRNPLTRQVLMPRHMTPTAAMTPRSPPALIFVPRNARTPSPGAVVTGYRAIAPALVTRPSTIRHLGQMFTGVKSVVPLTTIANISTTPPSVVSVSKSTPEPPGEKTRLLSNPQTSTFIGIKTFKDLDQK